MKVQQFGINILEEITKELTTELQIFFANIHFKFAGNCKIAINSWKVIFLKQLGFEICQIMFTHLISTCKPIYIKKNLQTSN